jgi:signal transduction histidine kinase
MDLRWLPLHSRIRTFRFWATVSVLVLVAATLATALIAKVERDAVASDSHTIQVRLRPVRTAEADLLTAFVNQETGQRGYLLTGDATYLQPYDMGRSTAAQLERQLRVLTTGDAQSTRLLDDVTTAGQRWQQRAAEPEIAARRDNRINNTALTALTREGKQLFDELRTRFDALIAHTESLITAALHRVSDAQEGSREATDATLISASVVAVLVLFGLWYLFARPLGRFLAQVQRVADGDYAAPIDARGPQEFEIVANAVDKMRAGILDTAAGAAAAEQRLSVRQERDRLAADLHDRTIQRVFGLGLALDALKSAPATSPEDLQPLVDETDRIIRELRSVIFSISQSEDSDGLRASIVALVADSRRGLGFLPELDLRGPLDTAVPEPVGAELLSVLREALSNVARHADANTATVAVRYDNDTLSLEVSDDGRGIAPDVRPGGGMSNLRRRAQRLAGTTTVRPGTDGGTVLSWQVPVPPQ